jgi:hypothetical protein
MKVASQSLSVSALALALALCVPAARAGEFFVNVATGSDANSGTSPGAAWKTLTRALQTAVDFDDFVHVAPGDHSAASGEVFPLHLGVAQLSGDGGSAVTRVVGTGTEVLFLADIPDNLEGVQLEGFSLVNAATGLRVVSTNDFAFVRLADIAIGGMSGFGIDLDAHSTAATVSPPTISTGFDGLEVSGCGGGVRLSSTTPGAASVLDLTNSAIHDNAGEGIRLDSVAGGSIHLSLSHTRVTGHGQAGVRALASGFVQMGFGSCLVADNGAGIDVVNAGGELLLGLFFSTVAGNADSGLRVGLGMPATGTIGGALFWGNGEDVTGGILLDSNHSDSEHGAFGTDDGNFSADPLFRNAALGDYHLAFGSPCVEAGNPIPFAGLDLDGAQQPADGDLDAVERLDVGCFELNPLVVETTGALGTPVSFGFLGSPCMMTSLFFAPGAPATAKATAFGKLRLAPAGILPLLVTIALSPDPNVVVATIPNVPALSGATFSFQSLTQSAVAPKLAALTNVASFTMTQ